MSTKSPGVHWMSETTLRVRERERRLSIVFGKFCLGALPALLLLQAGAKAVFIVPVAVVGLAYALVWLLRGLRMEFVAGPDGIVIRDAQTTRTLAWSEVDSFVDAFIPVNQGRAQWALGVKTTDGSIVIAQMTANGKPQGPAGTVQALRTVAYRHGVRAQLTGDAANNGDPTSAGWHSDPDGKPGERLFNGAMWGPIRRHPDPRGQGTLESWDPIGDPTAALELFTAEARAASKKRNRWIAITVVVTIIACALWGSEDHRGGSFTLSAIAFGAAALCAWLTWGCWKEARALERIVALASSPTPVPVGMPVGFVAPGLQPPPTDGMSSSAEAGAGGTALAPWKRDRMAVWSLVCAIGGLFTLGLGAILGIVLGFRARRRLLRGGGARRDVRLATAGLSLGAAGLLLLIGLTVVGSLDAGPGDSGDLALADQALLRASDYGVGWKDQGWGSGTSEASFFNSFSHNDVTHMTSCLGMSSAHIDTKPTEVTGHQFAADSGTLWATDTIDVFPTVADAAADDEAAASPHAAACEQLLQANQQGTFEADSYLLANNAGPAAVVRRQGVSILPARDADLEVSFPIKAPHSAGMLYIDMVFLRHGRVESNLWVVSENSQPPLGTINRLVMAARGRLASSGV
jgi:Domain of unknown function (DUF4190)